jgi:phosphoglycerate dehydrogenase-like enzyme
MSPKPVHPNQWHVGLIGYGEVGRILAEDLRKDAVRVSAYDLKLGGEQAAPLREHAEKCSASHAELRKAR